jgi:DNA helicase-2/ATP-dependent DNA helicase PcrA
MAAKRLGFLDMWDALKNVNRLQTGLRDGSLPGLRFFSHLILPLITANEKNDSFAVASMVRKNSPLLEKDMLVSCTSGQQCQVESAKAAVDSLVDLWKEGKSPTFIQVLNSVYQTKLFRIPGVLLPFAKPVEEVTEDSKEEDKQDELVAWRTFLETQFGQIERYSQYVQGGARYDTHQGVKGLEFPRVCVVMDDSESGGFMFSYEKLFGAKQDTKKTKPDQETSIDRTRRLFYVTCSRAEESLALIAYTANPETVRKHVLDEGWFKKDEIVLI